MGNKLQCGMCSFTVPVSIVNSLELFEFHECGEPCDACDQPVSLVEARKNGGICGSCLQSFLEAAAEESAA